MNVSGWAWKRRGQKERPQDNLLSENCLCWWIYLLTSWWNLVCYVVNLSSFSSELWYFLNVWSDMISRTYINVLLSWHGDLKGRCSVALSIASRPTRSVSLCALLLSPGAEPSAEPDRSCLLGVSWVCRDPSGRDLCPLLHVGSLAWGKSQLNAHSIPGHQDLARRQSVPSPQDFSEVTLNLENESLETFIYVFLVKF